MFSIMLKLWLSVFIRLGTRSELQPLVPEFMQQNLFIDLVSGWFSSSNGRAEVSSVAIPCRCVILNCTSPRVCTPACIFSS